MALKALIQRGSSIKGNTHDPKKHAQSMQDKRSARNGKKPWE